VRDLESLSNVVYPREREIRRLEVLLLEARQRQLQELAQGSQADERQRENISELMKKLTQMKAVGRYLR
jgi:hypothetical protein